MIHLSNQLNPPNGRQRELPGLDSTLKNSFEKDPYTQPSSSPPPLPKGEEELEDITFYQRDK